MSSEVSTISYHAPPQTATIHWSVTVANNHHKMNTCPKVIMCRNVWSHIGTHILLPTHQIWLTKSTQQGGNHPTPCEHSYTLNSTTAPEYQELNLS